jgi:UDP-N-acetylglucosamine diphosphorylase / glucose-1-phosphate thymidylyltransferase / UDP-N-acetylgalactosamine diphosphorylase / glucosamine-1-phosphate N-acetyltransferase / galactosamine-1-phosphate N-acetyltransferase
MNAVVMAAGEGSRLRPLTERWPKPVLPIDGRPVIATLLRELAAAGCTRAVVVTGHLAEQVEELVGDGSAFGLEIVFARQPAGMGSADTVTRALAAGAEPPLLVTAADTVYTPGDVRRVVEAYAASGAAGALAGRRDPPPLPAHRDGLLIVDGLVRKVVDDDPSTELGSAPLWILGSELVPLLDDLSGPPFELADVFKRALASNLPIRGIEIRATRDLPRPIDLVKENFPYLPR